MALLLRFSAVKLIEGQTNGGNSNLSLDVSMVETPSDKSSVAVSKQSEAEGQAAC